MTQKVLYKEVDGEKFYKVPTRLGDNGTIDIVISEYQFPTETGCYNVTGCLRSDLLKEPKEHLYTYFMGSRAVSKVDSRAPVNSICVTGRIVKKGRLSMLRHGKQLLPIVVRCKMDDGHTSIIHAVLFDKDARKLDSFEDVYSASINASGHVIFRYNAIEVHIDDAEIFRKE